MEMNLAGLKWKVLSGMGMRVESLFVLQISLALMFYDCLGLNWIKCG